MVKKIKSGVYFFPKKRILSCTKYKKVKCSLMPSFFPLPDIHPLPAPFPIRLARFCFLFATGGTLYYFIEILWRGHSHFSMFLCGGFCFAGLYLINRVLYAVPRILRWLLGALFITATEFCCGVAVNLFLGWNVWNYSDLPLNLLGQICLPFTVIWFFLCIPADLLCSLFRRWFRVELPRKY